MTWRMFLIVNSLGRQTTRQPFVQSSQIGLTQIYIHMYISKVERTTQTHCIHICTNPLTNHIFGVAQLHYTAEIRRAAQQASLATICDVSTSGRRLDMYYIVATYTAGIRYVASSDNEIYVIWLNKTIAPVARAGCT